VHYDKWIASESKGIVSDWVVCCAKNNGTKPNNVIVDGLPVGTDEYGTGNYQLGINYSGFAGEYSNWEFSQLIIWDKILTNQELQIVYGALNNYLLTGIVPIS